MATLVAPYFLRNSRSLLTRDIGSSLVRQQITRQCLRSKSTVVTVKNKSLNDEAIMSSDRHDEHCQSQNPRDPLDLSFSNTKQVYKSKTTLELTRALLVLKLSSFDFLINNHKKLIKLSRSVLGKRLFRLIMRMTFYGHFVAGEDEKEIQPVLERLRSFGVKSILDYSAEEDISESEAADSWMSSAAPQSDSVNPVLVPSVTQELKQFKPVPEFADRRKFNPTARTYFYQNEAQCEKNMEIFIKCIEAVAGVTGSTGFAAIKLTALGRPQLLYQLSEVIVRTRMLFHQVTGEDKMLFSEITPEEFQAKYEKRFDVSFDSPEANDWFKNMDYDRRGLMNLFSWNGLVEMNRLASDVFKVPNLKSGRMEPIIRALSRDEDEMFRNMMRRVHTIAKFAKQKDARVLIDAEQSYLQPAINRITIELMRKYNKEKAIVFNTYQCYLKNAYDSLVLDLEMARRQDFFFGAKLVRGAYMEQERLRAATIGYEDPINPSFEATTAMYEKSVEEAMRQIVSQGIDKKKIAVMIASHNEETVRFALQKMKDFGIRPDHKVICFGQLYGMCDHVSFSLGQSGFSVYKYVPYGPIEEVIPYLSRRGAENHGVLEKVVRERSYLKKEIIRRLTAGELFHVPVGNYKPI